MKIKEGNKIVADFMECIDIPKGETWPSDAADLKYHLSWDWLMPVVKKIKTIVKEKGLNWTGFVTKEVFYLTEALKNIDVEGIWLATIDFIEWYNIKEINEEKLKNNGIHY